MIGFLTQEGKFIKCESWEHLDKAQEICENRYNKVILNRQEAEDYLLSLGYMVFRARDVYMSYWDSEKNFRHLSEQQLKWLTDNNDEFNDMQKEDLNDILLDQNNHKEIVERYWKKQQRTI
jgi:hypothetical protein